MGAALHRMPPRVTGTLTTDDCTETAQRKKTKLKKPQKTGRNDPSFCPSCHIRMINQDVMDLYERVEPGARVVVLGAPGGYLASTRGGDRLPPLHQIVRDPDALARRGLW